MYNKKSDQGWNVVNTEVNTLQNRVIHIRLIEKKSYQ